jgi:hypothetical protein
MKGKLSSDFSAEGTVSSANGHYYFTASETGEKYELTGSNLKNYDGASVVASGILEAAAPAAGVVGIVLADSLQSSSSYMLPGGSSSQTGSLIGGLSIGRPRAMACNKIIQGADGGSCCVTVSAPCCQNTQRGNNWAGKVCCPGFFPPTSQCNASH